MSKSAAIQTAVWTQLSLDSRPLPSTGQEVMGNTYHYDSTSLRNFLQGVYRLLKSDTPSYRFRWTALDIEICLNDQVITLCGYIATETEALPSGTGDNIVSAL
jgi:hypothetical protein